MGKDIDEKTLQEAKEKLACKIEPATFSDGSVTAASSDAQSSKVTSVPQSDFIDPDGKVRLTRMTTAGG